MILTKYCTSFIKDGFYELNFTGLNMSKINRTRIADGLEYNTQVRGNSLLGFCNYLLEKDNFLSAVYVVVA